MGRCLPWGKDKLFPATFDLSRHFLSRDLSTSGFSSSVYVKKENLVTKRFVFNEETLTALKEATISAPGSTITAFIWKHFIEIMQGQSDNLNCASWQVVNLRTRTSLPVENVFGNCILKQFFLSAGAEFHELVRKLRNGIKTISDEYMLKARSGDDYLNDISESFDLVLKGEIEVCGFISWCRFPVYEVDCGWGKPAWVCPTSCPEKNVTFLMSTRDGHGIEAWVNLLESNSQLHETKFKLLETKKMFK